MTITIRTGDCIALMREMPAESVHTCVTSPPYFGLRDYGHEGQIGLEETPDAFVAKLVDVFREVRRVLRDDGTVWLNLGDSYASGTKGNGARQFNTGGLADKQLMGIPWRVAFALQADGWYLRQDIIWSKPNPMPESVTDRCTKSHEYIFLLTKSARYYFDAAAIAEPSCTDGRPQTARAHAIAKAAGLTEAHFAALRACGVSDAGKAQTTQSGFGKNDPAVQALADEAKSALGGYTREFLIAENRNKRSVWTVATQPYSGAHFATFPPDLIEPCIKAGCPDGGTVLDPFGGAGTTALVADRLGRNAILCELNPTYADMARDRVAQDAGLFFEAAE